MTGIQINQEKFCATAYEGDVTNIIADRTGIKELKHMLRIYIGEFQTQK